MMIGMIENLEAACTGLHKKASKEQGIWEKRLGHLGRQSFACLSIIEVLDK